MADSLAALAKLTILGGVPDPEYEKQKAKLEEVENRLIQQRRQILKDTCSFLLDGNYGARGALKEKTFTDQERALLETTLGEFELALQALDKCLEKVPSKTIKSEILYVASELLWTGSTLARFSPPLEPIARKEKAWQAWRSRQAKKAHDAEKSSRLREAIKAASKGSRLRSTWTFAESIRDDVHRHLRTSEDKWPSTRTIQRAISAMLKECRSG